MNVRAAQAGDGQRIEEIRVAGWHWAYAGLIDEAWLTDFTVTADRVRSWEERIATPFTDAAILVAEVDGTVQGFAAALPSRDDDLPDAFELAALYVDPRALRQGLGSALMAAALAEDEQPQVLWVLEGNAGARQFYERHGFRWDGTRKLLDLAGDVPEVRYRREPRRTATPVATAAWPTKSSPSP